MQRRSNRWALMCGIAVLMASACIVSTPAAAQNGGGNAFGVAGVDIDADGVLRTKMVPDRGGMLTRQRINEARASLSRDLAKTSKLRKVSLNRLEAQMAALIAEGKNPSDEMLNLAGLTSIEYVFFYPETNDIVIAGPAEGYFTNPAGRSVGLNSGKATLKLEDLVVALRAFGPNGEKASQIGCSIDPTQEGLQNLNHFLANNRPSNPNQANRFAIAMREALGMHKVTVQGISPNTHFAQVMVEADYRMKLIGIGLEAPRADMNVYINEANPRDVAKNAMQRWFFVPDYDCVLVSEDNNAMKLDGNAVKLLGENEVVNADGTRGRSGSGNRASDAYCLSFTKNYKRIAEATPVYAQLQNLMDMAIVAAYIQHQDYYDQAGWDLGVMADEAKYAVETSAAPTQVEAAVNVVFKRGMLMTPIGGGVAMHPADALKSNHIRYDDRGTVSQIQSQTKVELEDGQWWWD